MITKNTYSENFMWFEVYLKTDAWKKYPYKISHQSAEYFLNYTAVFNVQEAYKIYALK